jgi:hypothetical protein
MDMHFKKLAVTLVMALALVLSVGTAGVMGEIPSDSDENPMKKRFVAFSASSEDLTRLS